MTTRAKRHLRANDYRRFGERVIDLIEIQQEQIEWLKQNIYQLTTILLDLKADHYGYKRKISGYIEKLHIRRIFGKETLQKSHNPAEKEKVEKHTKKTKFK